MSRAIAPVVLEIRVRDARRGRDEIRPASNFSRERIVENDVGDALGLLRDVVRGLRELVGEALAVAVDEDRAFLEELGRRPQRGREKAHQERPQDPLRHHVHRPRDRLRDGLRGRQSLDEVACRRAARSA